MRYLIRQPELSFGHATTAGIKRVNDDAVAVHISDSRRTATKGYIALIADGVTSAEAGRDAARLCRESFVEEYLSTPDAWSVKTAAHTVLTSLNRDLFSRGAVFTNAERGYVCTLSIIVFKGNSAHLFHIGDTRILRIRREIIEQLTQDHRLQINAKQSVLARAMGLDSRVSVDYRAETIEAGDIYCLATDGLTDFVPEHDIANTLRGAEDLTVACERLTARARENGSDDNISCAVVRVDKTASDSLHVTEKALKARPFPPLLSKGDTLDGYTVIEEIHASPRSQVYRVEETETGEKFALKTPSLNFEDDATYIEHFIMESWIGKRIKHPNVLAVMDPKPERTALYTLSEYIDGEPLSAHIARQQTPPIHEVRVIIEQLVNGLRAFHRKEILHQDLKPDNILIDKNGVVKIADFGSCRVAGLEEIFGPIERDLILGTADYTAPEYQLHLPADSRSDLFGLGVITYEILTGRHPFGAAFAKCRSRRDFDRLVYRPAYHINKDVPLWLDGALEKAVQIDPNKRYETLSHFLKDLRKPNRTFLEKHRRPLIESNPLLFWKGLTAVLAAVGLVLLYLLLTTG